MMACNKCGNNNGPLVSSGIRAAAADLKRYGFLSPRQLKILRQQQEEDEKLKGKQEYLQ